MPTSLRVTSLSTHDCFGLCTRPAARRDQRPKFMTVSTHVSLDTPVRVSIGPSSAGIVPTFPRRVCIPVQSNSDKYRLRLIGRNPLSDARAARGLVLDVRDVGFSGTDTSFASSMGLSHRSGSATLVMGFRYCSTNTCSQLTNKETVEPDPDHFDTLHPFYHDAVVCFSDGNRLHPP